MWISCVLKLSHAICTVPYGLICLWSLKVYIANSDRHSVVVNVLIDPIEARFVRLNIEAWYSHISMRFELYGCNVHAGEKCCIFLLYQLTYAKACSLQSLYKLSFEFEHYLSHLGSLVLVLDFCSNHTFLYSVFFRMYIVTRIDQ